MITKSKDGTEIAYSVVGSGPAVILVDGALCYREFGPMTELAAVLAPAFTVYTYDRRGRGESGNTLPYSADREVEDVAAMIEAAGGSAMVAGQSSGSAIALRAAAAGLPITRLSTYEAPYMVSDSRAKPHDMLGTLQSKIAADDRAGALRFFMVDMVGAPAISMIFMRANSKVWKQLLDVSATLPYDALVMGGDFTPDLASFATIQQQTLVLRGGKAARWMIEGNELIAKTLPHSTYKVLPKQTHQVKASVIGPEIAEFFSADAPRS